MNASRLTLLGVAITSIAAAVSAGELEFPPHLPGGVTYVSDTSREFLGAPADFDDDVAIAKVPPRIDLLYYPEQTYPGNPWSVWGDSLAAKGKYWSAIGDHLAPAGNAFVFELDTETLALRTIANVKDTLDLPEGHYVPGKIHSRIDMGRDGRLYFATHRGSTRVTTDEYHYRGDWILRCDPRTATTEIVAHAPVPKHCIPTSVLDPERMIFYGGTAAGNRVDPVQFFAWDVAKRRVLHAMPGGPYRALILARSTGRVYWVNEDGGPLMRYDPATGEPPERIPGSIGLRAATRETADGVVYTVSTRGDGSLWRFDTKTEDIERIGDVRVGGQDYVTSLDVDPTGRYLYWVPGAHGGSERSGSPLVQFDVETRRKKVIAFLHPFYAKKYGYTPLGSFGSAVDPSGDRVFITWNGNRGGPDRRGRLRFDTCALTVVHVPASERSPWRFRDVAGETGLTEATRGMMAHAAAWGDADADGDLDLFVGTFADRPAENYREGGADGPVPNLLLRREGDRFVRDASETLAWRGRASGVVFTDLDGDGRDDLYVANNGRLGKENHLYRNAGDGRFEDVTAEAGAPVALPETARSAAVLDFDGDGRLDLLVLATVNRGRTLLFRNTGDVEHPLRFELSDAIPGDACGLGVATGDLTGDGWPDVLIGGPNRLFVNRGDGTFREVPQSGLGPGLGEAYDREDDAASCGVDFGDVNGDGRLDIVVGSHTKRPWREPAPLRLWINRSTEEHARFEAAGNESGLGPLPMRTPHVEIRDFDNDGRPDIYTAVVVHDGSGRVHPVIHRNLGASARGGVPRFEETAFRHQADFPNAEDLGPPGRSAVFYERLVERRRAMYFAPGPSADFDGDGRLDLFMASWFPKYPSLLLKNETPSGNFVDVEIAGAPGVNRRGIGALVLAYEPGRAGEPDALISCERIAASTGYCSGRPPVAHLGLGAARSCDIVVALPHGKGRIARRGVAANSRIRLGE